jgi:hypothetical protein
MKDVYDKVNRTRFFYKDLFIYKYCAITLSFLQFVTIPKKIMTQFIWL